MPYVVFPCFYDHIASGAEAIKADGIVQLIAVSAVVNLALYLDDQAVALVDEIDSTDPASGAYIDLPVPGTKPPLLE